jgi:hypothetical protein
MPHALAHKYILSKSIGLADVSPSAVAFMLRGRLDFLDWWQSEQMQLECK